MAICPPKQQAAHALDPSWLQLCDVSWRVLLLQVLTDLLNPEATHLLIREDVKKGIFVENLSSHVVHNSMLSCPLACAHNLCLRGTLLPSSC
jgi:hypothetical protein